MRDYYIVSIVQNNGHKYEYTVYDNVDSEKVLRTFLFGIDFLLIKSVTVEHKNTIEISSQTINKTKKV